MFRFLFPGGVPPDPPWKSIQGGGKKKKMESVCRVTWVSYPHTTHNFCFLFLLGGNVFFRFECLSVASKSTDSHTERGPFCSTCKQRVRHSRTHTHTDGEYDAVGSKNNNIKHNIKWFSTISSVLIQLLHLTPLVPFNAITLVLTDADFLSYHQQTLRGILRDLQLLPTSALLHHVSLSLFVLVFSASVPRCVAICDKLQPSMEGDL